MGSYDWKVAQKAARQRRAAKEADDDDDDDEEVPVPRYSDIPIVQKFFEQHGDFIRKGGIILFHDGAQLGVSSGGYGLIKSPPKNEYEAAKLRHQYYQEIARRAEDKFRGLRSTIVQQRDLPFSVIKESDLERLEELKDVASKARKRLKKAKRELRDATPAWMTAKSVHDAKHKARQHDLCNRAERINL